jgi:hypothetical protein
MRRAIATVAVLLSALTVLAACGDEEKPAGNTSDPVVIDVTIKGDSVTPNGERVDVAVGQEVLLKVTADAPGEIHVHSTPEQELEYQSGTQDLTIEAMDQPGTVDVESHALEKVIVQLEVR